MAAHRKPLDANVIRNLDTGEEIHLDEADVLSHPQAVIRDLDSGARTRVPVDSGDRCSARGEDNRLLKSGFLWKRGNTLGSWTKRWFTVCDDSFIYYYLSSVDAQPKGHIPAQGCTVHPLEEQEHTLQGYFGLAVVLNNKKRVLYAGSEEDMYGWVDAIVTASSIQGNRSPDMRLPANGMRSSECNLNNRTSDRSSDRNSARNSGSPRSRPDSRAGSASELWLDQGGDDDDDADNDDIDSSRLLRQSGEKEFATPAQRNSRLLGMSIWNKESADTPADRAGSPQLLGKGGTAKAADTSSGDEGKNSHGPSADTSRDSAQLLWPSVAGEVQADAEQPVSDDSRLIRRVQAGGSAAASTEDEEWELDSDGYRVRRKKGGSSSVTSGLMRLASASEDNDHAVEAAGKADEEGEEEEFKPVIQIKIRSADEATQGTPADLRSAAAAFKAPLPAPANIRGRRSQLVRASAEPTVRASGQGPSNAGMAQLSETEPPEEWREPVAFPPASSDGFGSQFTAATEFPAFPSSRLSESDELERPADGQNKKAGQLIAQAQAAANAQSTDPAHVPQAVRCMQQAFLALEAARFEEALRHLSNCLELLTRSTDVRQRIADIRFCAQYHVALSLLQQLTRLEAEGTVGEKARLSALLAALPLLPQHRKVCISTAIRWNLQAHNYGLTCTFIDLLMAKGLVHTLAPMQQAQLRTLRQRFEKSTLSDTVSVLVPCRHCAALTRVTASECRECGTRVHVCCTSHRVLRSDDFTWCPLCMCLFLPEVVPASTNCKVCSTGIVIAAGGAAGHQSPPARH